MPESAAGTPTPPAAQSLSLPAWADRLRRRYLAGVASQFLVHSNVFDLQPLGEQFVPLRDFLYKALSAGQEMVVFYNLSEGLTFATPQMREDFLTFLSVYSQVSGARLEAPSARISAAAPLPKEPSQVLPILEKLIATRNRVAVIIDYTEMLAPATDVAFMGAEERRNLTTLRRWASSPELLRKNSWVFLVGENLAGVHPLLQTSTSRLDTVQIPLPDEQERLAFIQHIRQSVPAQMEMSAEQLAALGAGMNRVQIESLFRDAHQDNIPITFDTVRERKKELIEMECGGLVEFVEPRYGFEAVGGSERITSRLGTVARALRERRHKRVPMGILCSGPPGTGKNFVMEAFAKECGLSCVRLRNFRSKWVGSTEANVEKLFSILGALQPVLVIIDEMDQSFGSRPTEADSGTSSRVFAMFSSFISNPDNRGRILWVGMCNRPDLLDPATKRPGRFELRIPFFKPETEERRQILQSIFRRYGITAEMGDDQLVLDASDGYTGADLENVVLAADALAEEQGAKAVTAEHLLVAARDLVPASADSARVAEYMELLAVGECSSKRLLPDKYREALENGLLAERLDALRAELEAAGLL